MRKKLVRFEPDLLRAIVRAARMRHVNASQFIRDACREKIERDAAAQRIRRAVEEAQQ